VAAVISCIVTCLALAGVTPTPARAADAEFGPPPPAFAIPAGEAAKAPAGTSPAHPDDGRRTMGRLPANLGRGAIGVFNRDNLVPLLVGAAATGGSAFLDDDVQQAVTEQYGWGDSFETAGGPIYSTIFVAGMFTAGRLSHGDRFRATTYDMLDAAVVGFAYTSIIKVAVGRERPNGEDNRSFPSGHTSNAFALATVAQRHYGWKLGVPSYLLAGLMGASRVSQDKHWLSDVVAGAALGYIVGRTVVRVNGKPLENGTRKGATWTVAPIVARHARGLQMSVEF
jgi:membrane-associated phospholipid phosphatase